MIVHLNAMPGTGKLTVARILSTDRDLIFTNALAAELPEDRARFEQIAEHARTTGQIFWQILLTCELAENQRRIVDPERRLNQKLGDPGQLAQLHRDYTIYHPPAAHRLEIDTTRLAPEETAETILAQL